MAMHRVRSIALWITAMAAMGGCTGSAPLRISRSSSTAPDQYDSSQSSISISENSWSSSSSSFSSSNSLQWGQRHVIRRLYGEENHSVRRHIAELEERMQRYRTGLPTDPDHVVPYNNHPYSRTQRREKTGSRSLSESSSSSHTNISSGSTSSTGSSSTVEGGLFQPIRMTFYTAALDSLRDSTNAAQIDWIKNAVLPATGEFWSLALSVVPVSGPLRISSSDLDQFKYCGDSALSEVPDVHKSAGVSNTDLILYVSGSASSKFCPQNTLAVAVPCNFDQFDRPTAGAINICLGNVQLNADGTASHAMFRDYVDVTTHEVAHVLGMSSNSYRFFWDPDTGKPRTSRPFSEQSVVCADGNSRSVIVPDTSTLAFQGTFPHRFAAIVTPKVRAIARNQFDCQSLIGAQLENQDTRADSCTGDHWDERQYFPEAMTAILSPTTNVMTSLTLALMEDSGWYRANYTMSRMSPWGLGVGCDFATQPCLIAGSGDPQIPDYSRGFFCKQAGEKGCSSELSTKLACTVIDYYYLVPQQLPPTDFQYFASTPTKGGIRQTDYCPVYSSTYSNLQADGLDCTNAANSASFNIYSEEYGSSSKCITSTVGQGLCYKTACVQQDMKLWINVIGQWYVCDYDFQQHSIRVGQGLVSTSIICPRLSQACPELFCPFNCAGRGVCNYANTVNGTIRPKCECFDKSDKSVSCSDSQMPNGGFLRDASGLRNNVQQNFFDPLLAVFVDHPEAWTTSSWAWAGGLLGIFLLLLLCICSSICPKRSNKY